jgi:polar amino acid transport system ATP-binding protein
VREVLGIIRELKEDGMTMLIATHEMGFAREFADEVCHLDGGQIVERGAPGQIFSEPAHPSTRGFLAHILEGQRT